MSKYPDVITEETLEINAHISTEQIEQDIYETQLDIKRVEQEVKGHYLIAEANNLGSPTAKIEYFKATAKEQQVQKMRDLLEFLERLLEARNNGS